MHMSQIFRIIVGVCGFFLLIGFTIIAGEFVVEIWQSSHIPLTILWGGTLMTLAVVGMMWGIALDAALGW